MHPYAGARDRRLNSQSPTNHNPSDYTSKRIDWTPLADLLPASHLSQGASSTWEKEKRAGVYFYIHILAFDPIMVICSDLPPERFGACNKSLGWRGRLV